MFTINSTEIQNDILVSNVTLEMDDKSTLVVNVPVKFPQTTKEVLAAKSSRPQPMTLQLWGLTVSLVKTSIAAAAFTLKYLVPAPSKLFRITLNDIHLVI